MVAFAGYPLLVGDQVVGVMALFARQPLPDSTVETLGSVANSIALLVQRKRAEAALRDSEERYRKLVELSPDAVFVQCDGKFVYANNVILRLLGLTEPAQVLGKSILNFVHPDSHDAAQERMRQLREERRSVPLLEQKWVRADGSVFEVEVAATPFEYQGQPAALVILRDISERKQAERRLALVMEASNTGLWDWDVRTNWVYLSPVWKSQLGYADDEIENRFEEWERRLHPEDQERVLSTLRAYLQAPWTNYELEFRLRHKDGSYRWMLSRAAGISDAQGKVCRMAGVHLDITERKHGEQERNLMEVQLRQAQKLESIGHLAAGIAHEINTPTQFIGDNTRFVRDAFADLQKLLVAQQRLLDAAKQNAVTPELITEVEEAAQTADIEYLSSEIPKAIDQSLEGVERVTKIVRAMKEFSHPGTTEKVALDLNKAIESTTTVCRNEWKYVADMVTDFDASQPCPAWRVSLTRSSSTS
jgi:PAS domain S-box-containing protein